VKALRDRVVELRGQVETLKSVLGSGSRVFAAGRAGEVVAVRAGQRPSPSVTSSALVVWRARR
jgi:MerR family transcriptional regulator/heat shock protein HspR